MTLKFPKSEKYNFNKNLVKRFKLVTHLDRYLADEPENFSFEYTPKRGDDAWHPSGNCTPKPTELYYYATEGHKEPRDISVALQKTFMVGHFWHQLLQYAVLGLGFAEPWAIERRGWKGWDTNGWKDVNRDGASGNVIWQSDPAKGGYPWHDFAPFHWATGSGDVAPCTIPTHGDFTVDFKTMSSMQFKTNGIPGWAADKYEAQINIYMDWFDTERGLIVALNKDSPHDMKEFEFVRNQALIDAIYDKWEFVSVCLDEGIPPTALDDDAFEMTDLFTGPVAQ